MTDKETKEFKLWLQRLGAEVLAPTNPYELVRFRARGGTHVVYRGRRGITADGFAQEAMAAFRTSGHVDMGLTATQRTMGIKYRAALLERDGRECFFCWKPMPNTDMTVEHLVPIHKGGPNHLDNMVLAHAACNRKADNLPLIKKVEMRVVAATRQEEAA